MPKTVINLISHQYQEQFESGQLDLPADSSDEAKSEVLNYIAAEQEMEIAIKNIVKKFKNNKGEITINCIVGPYDNQNNIEKFAALVEAIRKEQKNISYNISIRFWSIEKDLGIAPRALIQNKKQTADKVPIVAKHSALAKKSSCGHIRRHRKKYFVLGAILLAVGIFAICLLSHGTAIPLLISFATKNLALVTTAAIIGPAPTTLYAGKKTYDYFSSKNNSALPSPALRGDDTGVREDDEASVSYVPRATA